MTKPVQIGVIGAGGIAYRKTIPGILQSDLCRLVAVMDPVGIDKIVEQFGVESAYTTEEQLLADGAIEAVYIASPVKEHLRQIRLAAEAGKHILCEKPLTMTIAEAAEAVAVCEKNGVFLQEGYMMKFHGAHQKIKQLIDAGELGKVVYIRAQLSCWYPKIEGAWRQDPALGGGGALIDMATHLYDLLEYWLGPAKKVTAMVNTLVQDYKSDDASTTLLEFESGTQATVDCFYCIPDAASRTRLEVYGSGGAVLTEGTISQAGGGKCEGIFGLGDAGYDADQAKDIVREYRPVDYDELNPYAAEFDYFAKCIRTNVAPVLNGTENALRIARLSEAAYASYRDSETKII
jgi:predicted dehydrogenase